MVRISIQVMEEIMDILEKIREGEVDLGNTSPFLIMIYFER